MSNCENLPLSMKLNTLESDLGGWTIVIFAVITSGLLFYHMTQMKSLLMKPTHAAILAILLLLTAIAYSIYSLYNFFHRTSYLLDKQTNECTRRIVNKSRIIYSIITGLVCLILIAISVQIFSNTRKYF